MKKFKIAIAGLAAMGGLIFMNARALGQGNGGTAQASNSQPAPAATKIGVVNILKVVKDFKKADVLGKHILDDAQKYEMDLNSEKEALKQEQQRIQTLPEGPEKETKSKALRDKIHLLEDKDQAAKKDITKRRDDMAIEINRNIQTVIDSLARHYGFEMVFTYPDVTDVKERNTINDAMRHITAPGMMLAWCDSRLDITEECIRWLNHYFKPPEGTTSAPSGANVTPAAGTQQR